MAKFTFYRSYRFTQKDQVCDALKTMIRDDEHLNNNQVRAISGVAAQTIHGWLDGPTQRPQNATITAVASSLGYVRRDYFDKRTGRYTVAFQKDLPNIDYREEIKKQADWLLKHGNKKKRNGK